MKVIDPGHVYHLDHFDGAGVGTLRFVKRCNPPSKYPGNRTMHPGAITQDVLRCLIERSQYVNRQTWHWVNPVCVALFRLAITLLEFRVMLKKWRFVWPSAKPEAQQYCKACGHWVCGCAKESTP